MPIFKKKDQKEAHSYDDIIKGFQYAVNSAQDILAAQQLEMLGRFFDNEGNAVSQKIKTAAGSTVKVPLMALVPHNTLAIDEIEMNFVTKVRNFKDRAIKRSDYGNEELGMVGTEMNMDSVSADSNDTVRVTIKFKTIPQPEALSRIIDEQCKLL